MLCPLCRGNGSHITSTKGVLEFWDCCACGGSGCRIVYGPAEIGPGARVKEQRRRALQQKIADSVSAKTNCSQAKKATSNGDVRSQ